MRKLRISMILPLLLAAALVLTGCNSGQSQVQQQEAQVTRGDLLIKANGSGTVGVDTDARVSFGNGGKIVKLNLKEGDRVAKDAVIIQFDTDNLELALLQARTAEAQAQLALIQAGVSVTNARLAQTQAEVNVTNAQLARTQAEANVTNAQLAQNQAESALEAARFDLDRTEAISDIKDEITEAEWQKQIASMNLQEALALKEDSVDYWQRQILYFEIELAKKQKKLTDLLAKDEYSGALTYDIMGQTYDRLTIHDVRMKQLRIEAANQSINQARQNVEMAKLSVDQAGKNVEQAKLSVDQARQTVDQALQPFEQAKRSLEQASKAVAIAQKQLNEAAILAPIDGTVLTLNAKEGDTILAYNLNPVTPLYLADLNSIQVKALIDEIDIAAIKTGQRVIINLDSAPDVRYEGTVKAISTTPVANPQSSGVVVYEVKIGFCSPPPPEVKLGMSATVDIITKERKDILLAPSRAIKEDDQGNTLVDILVNKKTETRQVKTGLSDGITTEILSGLESGDTVVIKRATQSLGLFGQ